MNYILNQFTIENNQLINFENKVFPLIKYDSEFLSELVYRLQDPDLAKAIHHAYSTILKDTLNKDEKIYFEKALLKVCFLFGSSKFPPHLGLRLALLEENFSVDTWMKKHEIPYQQFMKLANPDLYPIKKSSTIDQISKIVITTTSAAGGNLSVAEGIKKLLEKKYKVIVIDVEKISEEVDHIKIATGTHTFDKIYAEIIQQKNSLNEGFDLQMNVGRKIARYIEPILGKTLKQKIMAENPDFILSTRNGHELDITLSHSLGIPGSTIHCDCEVGYYYNNIIGKTESQLFKIWLPESHPRVFKPVLDRLGKAWKDYESLPWNLFHKTLAQFLHIPAEVLDNQIEFVGAPLRPEIKFIKDKNLIKSLREKWDLPKDHEAVVVTLGQNGVGKMKELFDELIESNAHRVPIKYYFICGTNHDLKSYFDEKLKSSDLEKSALKACAILGFLSGSEMNELLNISLILQGKPGGSQKEECLKIGIPLMTIFIHEYWESGNQAKLEREGFALSYDSQKSIAEQTENHVISLKNKKLERVKRIKWKYSISQAIDKALEK